MKQGSGTIFYTLNDADETELWQEKLMEGTRVPCKGEQLIVFDAEDSVPNAKEGEYTWHKYNVLNVITFINIHRSWDVFSHHYQVILEDITDKPEKETKGEDYWSR